MIEGDGGIGGFYSLHAETYGNRSRKPALSRLVPFCHRLSPGARILELGCGGGQDSAALLDMGFDVTPSDGTPEMAAVAEQRLGRPVQVLRFEEIDEIARYDGIWASACLLHVPRTDLADVLTRIRVALRTGGLFYASYKAGTAEGLDRFGRYYNRPERSWLQDVYQLAGWQELTIDEAQGGGYDGEPTAWLHITAMA